MSLDVSGAEQLVRDFLQMSDDYRAHDPDLSAELTSKAHEICRDFDIDVSSLGEGKAVVPKLDFLDAATMAEHESEAVEAEPSESPEAIDEQDQLLQILDHQRALVQAQANDQVVDTRRRRRSSLPGRSMFSSWLRLETA
ncbi:MAG: hypothetical protein ACR2QH_08630 [Geminicoccaceae bacterium]